MNRYASRKFLVTLISLFMSFGLAWHLKWDATGWGWALLACLGTHAAGNVMDTKFGVAKPNA